jgi:hypothetical protein
MKKTILAGALLAGLASTSCLGPDPAYGNLKNWNATVTDMDWLNEGIFLGLNIIPVYPLALVGDILIFNTIGYWSGNYIFGEPGPFPGFKMD